MVEFTTPVDICNRGMMHIGATRIDPTLGFTENSRQASACSFVYGKLRRAEMRRRIWRFSIRKAALRAVGTTTLFLSPPLWSSSSTYYLGSVVIDQGGTLWISNSPDNTNNQPGFTSPWDLYYGPLSVTLWDNTGKTTYFAGELVYMTTGNGAYSAFLSLLSGNTDNPFVPRQWTSTTLYQKDQIVQFAPAWASGTTYSAGQMVTYTDGFTYASLTSSNHNNIPSSSGANWVQVPALPAVVSPLSTQNQTIPTAGTTPAILEYDATVTYSIGQFVDIVGTQYVSLVSANLNNPPATSGSQWAQITNGTLYMSMVDVNVNNEPDLAPALWASGTTYAANAKVCGSDGVIYTSVGSGNVGNNPTTDAGVHWTNTGTLCPWTTLNLSGSGSLQWRQLPSPVLSEQNIPYPIGSGPVSQVGTRNIYRLPANYLRKAPQDPKAGYVSALGSPAGLAADDWEFEGNYIVTHLTTPIVLRFVADVADVTAMDDMFCEALGARIGLETCEEITQSTAKKQSCATEYSKWITEAGMVNGIEEGAVDPPVDDLITCRL